MWEDKAGGDNTASTGSPYPPFTNHTFDTRTQGVIRFQGSQDMGVENQADLSIGELSMYAVVQVSATSGVILSNFSDTDCGYGWVWGLAEASDVIDGQGRFPAFFTGDGTSCSDDVGQEQIRPDGFHLLSALSAAGTSGLSHRLRRC